MQKYWSFLIKNLTGSPTADLIFASVNAAGISLFFTGLNGTIQFSLTLALILGSFMIPELINLHFGAAKDLNLISQLVILLFISILNLEFLVVFLNFSILYLVLSVLIKRTSLLAFAFHLAESFFTLIVLSRGGTEKNFLIRTMIDYLGALPSLLISKILLVGIPIIYAVKSFNTRERQIFLNIILCLGISLTVRNMFYLIS